MLRWYRSGLDGSVTSYTTANSPKPQQLLPSHKQLFLETWQWRDHSNEKNWQFILASFSGCLVSFGCWSFYANQMIGLSHIPQSCSNTQRLTRWWTQQRAWEDYFFLPQIWARQCWYRNHVLRLWSTILDVDLTLVCQNGATSVWRWQHWSRI